MSLNMTQDPVLDDELPDIPWLDPALWRLPGMRPLGAEPWLRRTGSFAGQMALRDRLVAEAPGAVHACLPEARPAARECLDLVLEALADDPGYRPEADGIRRPDGVRVPIDGRDPLLTAGRLVQEDLCLLLAGPDGHRLAAAILCFPAGWTLSEKLGRPLIGVHAPVHEYDDRLARGVQRLFDTLRPGRPLWRQNALLYDDPALHTPLREGERRRYEGGASGYVRSERQTLVRLPRTEAVVFSILTYMVPVARLPREARAAMDAAGLKTGAG